MFNPHTNSPSTSWFQQGQQQPMMTGFNPFRQSTMMPQVTGVPAQPFVMPQATGFASPFAQPNLQPQMTGMPFPNAASPFPQALSPQATQMPNSAPTMPFQQQMQMNTLQPQPTGFLQPQQTGFNPFRQSMAFSPNGTMPFSQGAGPSSPQSVQPRSSSAMTFSVPSSPSNNQATQATPSHSPFAAALINRPASTPIGSGSNNGQMMKPVVSHTTGSRNPFGQLKAPSPPPMPKPPTLADLSFGGFNMSNLQSTPTGIQQNGFNQQNGAPFSNQQNGAPFSNQQTGVPFSSQQTGAPFSSQQPFSSRLASALGDSGNPGQTNNNMSSVASAFAMSSDANKLSSPPFTAQSPAPSQITSQMTSTSAFSDSFSNLSFGTSTGTNPSSVGAQPLQPQATGFAGLKTFKPTSSFGASLVESLPAANTGSITSNSNNPGNTNGTGAPPQLNLPSFMQNSANSNPASPLNPQQTGFSPYSTNGSNLFLRASGANGLGNSVGVGLRPQMTGGGASNPFRASAVGSGPFGGAGAMPNLSAMQTGGLPQGSSMGANLFNSGNSAFKPSLATIPSFTGAFPNANQQHNQQQSSSLI